MSGPLRVGICGFGVAGGALAVLLARAGHDVTLLERAPEVGPVGAGFLLQPSGQRVLAAMGLFDAVASRSTRIVALEAFTDTGRRLTDLRYRHGSAYGVQRGVLFAQLHAGALAAGVKITLNAEVFAVEESEGAVHLRDMTERTHGPFDLLIGADGSRSWLREWLNPGGRRREYIHGALWGSGRSPWPADVLHQVTRGARRLLGLLPIGEGRCAFFWGIRRDEVNTLKSRGFDAFRAEAVAMCPDSAAVLDDIGSFERLTFAGYLHALPRRTHSKRVVLVGDAAHSTSPHLGQGANLALLDAECLARHLVDRPLTAALAAYAGERGPHSSYLARLSRWLSPFFQSDSAILGWGRDIALPLMGAIPWMRGQMEMTLAGEKTRLLDRL